MHGLYKNISALWGLPSRVDVTLNQINHKISRLKHVDSSFIFLRIAMKNPIWKKIQSLIWFLIKFVCQNWCDSDTCHRHMPSTHVIDTWHRHMPSTNDTDTACGLWCNNLVRGDCSLVVTAITEGCDLPQGTASACAHLILGHQAVTN